VERTPQHERAQQFRRLHEADAPLLLFNAWDMISARVIAQSFPAIATSSFAVAASLGYEDGEQVPLATVLAFVERLTAAVSLPVSVDFEGGYGDTAAAVGETVDAIVRAGAVGINLEDGLRAGERVLVAPDLQAAKIAAARDAARSLGVPLFINARIDTFLLPAGSPDDCLDAALQRAQLYTEAGADGLFVPFLLDLALIERLTAAVALPVNIMAQPGCPGVEELARAGVRRISLGAWPLQAAMQRLAQIAAAVAAAHSLDALLAE
jgi:2-methylisocitrate lyase-like PEP mutase family enzyme